METTNRRHCAMLLLFNFVLLFQGTDAFALKNSIFEVSNNQSHQLDSAEILKLKGFYYEAIDICESVREISCKSKDWETYTRSLVEHADILRFSYYFSRNKEEIDQALILMEDAKNNLITNLDQDNITWIRFYIYMGKLHRYMEYENKNNVDSLLIYLDKAKAIAQKYPGQYYELAKVNYELGNYFFTRQMMSEAKPFIQNLLDISVNQLPEYDYFKALYLEKIGSYYADVGDLERSALCLENALYLYDTIHKDKINTIKTRLNLGNTYYFLDNISQKALNIYKSVIKDGETYNLTSYNRSIISYQNASSILYEQGDLDSCIYLAKKALEQNRNQTARDKLWSSVSKMNLGRASYKLDTSNKMTELFTESIEEVTEALGDKSFDKQVNFRCIGEVYLDYERLDSALVYFQKGLIALFDEFNSPDIYENPDFESYDNKEAVLYIVFDKAKALYKQYLKSHHPKDLQASLLLYEKAYKIIKGLINNGFMAESMITLFQYFKEDFQISVDCAIQAYNESSDIQYFEKAFQFIEQSKYFLLLKSQQSALLKERIGIADSLFLKERILSKELEYLKHQLSQKKQSLAHENYQIRKMMLQKLLLRSLIRDHINDFEFEDGNSLFLTLDEVQKEIVAKEDIVIEYYRSESKFIAIIIGQEINQIVQIPITSELLKYISDYSQSVSNKKEKKSKVLYNSFVTSSYQLYKNLFLPVLEVVSENCSRVPSSYNYTIVSDGELSYLPFEAFTTSHADTSVLSYWSLPYVCKEYVINYTFSLSVQKGNKAKRSQKLNNHVLALSYSPTNIKQGFSAGAGELDELPYSAKEIASAGSHFANANFKLIEGATEMQFKEEASKYSIIHLAIHGQADTIDRYNSKLIFRSEEDAVEDGILRAYELYNLDLSNSQLVVLSACETGIGKQVEGEGIFSIARGFAFAGCPTLVMSLWRANDKSTYMLMDLFYEHLALGMKKDKALQQAKIKFINKMNDYDAHPSNWATFVVLGNNEPIRLTNNRTYIYTLYALLLFIVSGALIIYTKKRGYI